MDQKGRTTPRRWLEGEPQPGPSDQRSAQVNVFAAQPATGAEVAIVPPTVSPAAITRFLAELPVNLGPGVNAVLVPG